MSAVTDQMAATMEVFGLQVPEVVVYCSYVYPDGAGTNQPWSGSGVAAELRGAAQYDPSGQWIRGGLSLTLKVADLPPRWPTEGDVIDVRRGDAEAVSYVIKNVQPTLQSILTLTLEKRFK